MDTNIAKIQDLKPASFGFGNDRSYSQTKYIIDLLKSSIEESKIITREDIVNCFLDYKFHGIKIIKISERNYWAGEYEIKEYTRDEYRKTKCYPPTIVQWFKSNLGGAILKGRILAIPIIEIE